MAKPYTTCKGTIAAKPSGAYKKDTGTIMFAGTVGSRWNANNDISTLPGSVKVPGPETLATIAAGTDTRCTFQPLSSGDWLKIRPDRFVITRVTTKLANVANTALQSGANASYRRSINRTPDTYDSVVCTSWNWVTGQPATAINYSRPYKSIDGTTSKIDNVAFPTRAIPGELTLSQTGSTPTNKDYSAKNT